MPSLFVAGAHTDVGKTFVACALIAAARARGLSVEAVKPLVSGFDPADWSGSDPGRLLTALGRPHSHEALEAMSPWRYRAPLAPPMAARLEGRSIDLAQVAAWCRLRLSERGADLGVVEGVGGVMSPLTETETGLDLMAALGAPCLLVGGAYLGSISHTLTAVEALRSRDLPLLAVVVSQGGDPEAPSFAETVASLIRFIPDRPVLAAPRDGSLGWAAAALEAIL